MNRFLRISLIIIMAAMLLAATVFAATSETAANGTYHLLIGVIITLVGCMLVLLFNTDRQLISTGGKYVRHR